MRHILYTDGGARGNPGPAAIGAVLYDGGKVVFKISKTIGNATNNQAEYAALIEGLNTALEHKIEELSCRLDSELIVKQLKGEYKIKEEHLKPLALSVFRAANRFKYISYSHVPREQNKLADELVNKALDNQEKSPAT
jgi:ribonuclease HI